MTIPSIGRLWSDYSLYLLVAALMLGFGLAQPESSRWLQFDRSLIDQGEYWRLLTANWVHLSANHLTGNLLGMALFAYIAGPYLNNRLGLVLILWCTLWVGVGLYFYAGYLERYVGMSGALHGFLLVAPFVSRFYSARMAWIFAVVIIAKTIWEQTPWYDDMAMQGYIGGRVETNSHLMGTIAGVLFLIAWCWYKKHHKGK